MKSFFIALQFLSRIHVVTQTVWTEADFGRSVIFFPLVGTVIGAVICLAYVGISLWFSQPYMAVLLVLCWLLVTGGLHADGLMDTADGGFFNFPMPASRDWDRPSSNMRPAAPWLKPSCVPCCRWQSPAGAISCC